MTDALVTAYMPLARRLAARFGRRFAPLYADDFESAAMLGLTEAAQAAEHATAFATYATRRIRWRLVRCCRELFGGDTYKPRVRAESLGVRELAVVQPDPAFVSDDALDGLTRPLSPSRRAVVLALYRDGLEPIEAAGRLGTSRQHVAAAHKRALAQLRGAITAGAEAVQ